MRPRGIPRGKVRVGPGDESGLHGFNEAAGNSPRKEQVLQLTAETPVTLQ